MGTSKLLRTTCLTVAGVATAWGAAATPAQADDHTVTITATATIDPGSGLTNPQFLYVANSSEPSVVPGISGLPSANFADGSNTSLTFSVIGHDDGDVLPSPPFFPLYNSVYYTVVGLDSNGDLIAGLSPSVAASISNTSFDSLFPGAIDEATLKADLANPGASSDADLTNFISGQANNSDLNSYTYFNFQIPTGDADPASQMLDLVRFEHVNPGDGDEPRNDIIGTIDLTLATDVPEPASLMILGAPALLLLRRRKRS